MSVLQPRLFDNLPPTREETPVHQLNYPTFAGAENTMWHGRTMNSPVHGWDHQREDPVHVGTFESAAERVFGNSARRADPAPSGALDGVVDTRHTSRGPIRPAQDLMELAAVGVRGDRQQMLPFRIREGSMLNTPDMPVSDSYANLAEGRYGDGYEDTYIEELTEAGVLSEEEYEDLGAVIGPGGDFGDHYPEPLSESGGVYYRNSTEDHGSVSAVVPTAQDLQHWPTEVMQHSTNPAQRRTAEFLVGRGY